MLIPRIYKVREEKQGDDFVIDVYLREAFVNEEGESDTRDTLRNTLYGEEIIQTIAEDIFEADEASRHVSALEEEFSEETEISEAQIIKIVTKSTGYQKLQLKNDQSR